MVDRKLQTEEAVVDRPSFMGSNYWTFILICLVAGGFASIVSFRVFQPYAFDGLTLDPRWVADITQQRAQATGEADMPWNLQWARRTHFYSFTNLTVWGLGLPLGILAWAGFLLMGWRVFKGEWRHALLWGWTALYFFWQSMQFNPTMRYQLPIYPLLEMMAAWFLFELASINVRAFKRLNVGILLAGIVGISVVALTFARNRALPPPIGFLKISPVPSTFKSIPMRMAYTTNLYPSRRVGISKREFLTTRPFSRIRMGSSKVSRWDTH
jgi:hypothetical protein